MAFVTEFGGYFNTREEAEEACLEDQSIDEFSEYFSFQVGYDRLLQWALRQNKFFDDFADQIEQANTEYFRDMITEWDDEE